MRLSDNENVKIVGQTAILTQSAGRHGNSQMHISNSTGIIRLSDIVRGTPFHGWFEAIELVVIAFSHLFIGLCKKMQLENSIIIKCLQEKTPPGEIQ